MLPNRKLLKSWIAHVVKIAVLSMFSTLALTAAKTSPLTPQFAIAKVADAVTLRSVPMPNGESLDFSVQRQEVYADGARVVLVEHGVERELPRSTRHFFSGVSSDGSARLALSTDADGQNASGVIFYQKASADVRLDASGVWQLATKPDVKTPKNTPTFQCGTTPQQSFSTAPSILGEAGGAKPIALGLSLATENALFGSLADATPAAIIATSSAVLAFDVDVEAMTKKFGGSSTTATNYLANLVNALNIYYGALDVRFLVGTSFLRTGSDPYGTTTDVAAQLDLLGAHWRDNHANVPRAFVLLISAVQTGGCGGIGVAWVDAYCRNGTSGNSNVYGSYSANQLFYEGCGTVENDLLILGHELGHNFGSRHTHCESNGAGGTIDRCFTVEGGTGCATGLPSCPAGGGTLMSYCNQVAGCNTSLNFHPVQVGLLLPKIAAAVASGCFQRVTPDLLLRNGFE
jgi:hypothetical protein